MKIKFETPNLLVREFSLQDFEAVHGYASKAEVVQYQMWGPNSENDTLTFLEETIAWIDKNPRLTFGFGIVLKKENKLIGGCGIYLKEQDLSAAKIGYIINPQYWNMGFATEATQGLVNYGQNELSLKTIKATCDQRNLGSKRVLEKNGFVLEAILENHVNQKGVMRTSFLFNYPFGK